MLAVRRAVLQVTAAHGALDEAAALEAGIARPGVHLTEYDHTPEFAAYYRDLQRLRVFHALPHHPRLMGAWSSCWARRCGSTPACGADWTAAAGCAKLNCGQYESAAHGA